MNFPEEASFLLERTERVCGKNRRLHGGRLCRKEDVLIYSRCETWPGKLARCLYWLCFITRLCFRWELCSASPSWPPDTQSQERGWPAARPGFVMRRAEGFSQSTLLPLPQCHKENRGSQNAWVERDPKAPPVPTFTMCWLPPTRSG